MDTALISSRSAFAGCFPNSFRHFGLSCVAIVSNKSKLSHWHMAHLRIYADVSIVWRTLEAAVCRSGRQHNDVACFDRQVQLLSFGGIDHSKEQGRLSGKDAWAPPIRQQGSCRHRHAGSFIP